MTVNVQINSSEHLLPMMYVCDDWNDVAAFLKSAQFKELAKAVGHVTLTPTRSPRDRRTAS